MQPAASGASEGFIGLFPCQCRRPRSRAALPRATAGCSSPGRFATCRRRNEFGGIPKRNFEIFKAPDFIAAALLHLPPKGQQTVRYYGVYSNKIRGRVADKSPSLITESAVSPSIASGNQTSTIVNYQSEFLLVAPPPKRSARLMRPLWRDLILQVWGGDPLECPCCHGTMKIMRPVLKCEEVEFFLRLHGLWEGLVNLPRPPPPPFDIESLQRIEPPWRAIKEWIPDDEPNLNGFNQPRNARIQSQDFDDIDQSPTWQAPEILLDEGRTLVLEYI